MFLAGWMREKGDGFVLFYCETHCEGCCRVQRIVQVSSLGLEGWGQRMEGRGHCQGHSAGK